MVSQSSFAFMCATATSHGLPKSSGGGNTLRELTRQKIERNTEQQRTQLNKEIRIRGHVGWALL